MHTTASTQQLSGHLQLVVKSRCSHSYPNTIICNI
jgi:hypothetical protein